MRSRKHHQPGHRHGNAIGNAGTRQVQPGNPWTALENGRQRQPAEHQQSQGECTAEQRGVEEIIGGVIGADP
jgi:hypothetical protein